MTYFFIVGFSNAVNLTDGLDGLAIMPTVLVGGALGLFAYVTGNVNFSEDLGIPYVAGTGEIMVFCAAMAGAGLGFLCSVSRAIDLATNRNCVVGWQIPQHRNHQKHEETG